MSDEAVSSSTAEPPMKRRFPRRLRPDSSHPYKQGLPANVPYNSNLAPLDEGLNESGQKEPVPISVSIPDPEASKAEEAVASKAEEAEASKAEEAEASKAKEAEKMANNGKPNGTPASQADPRVSTATKFAIIAKVAKLMRKKNRVVDSAQALAQSEFMSRFGVVGEQSEAPREEEPVQQESRWRIWMKQGVMDTSKDIYYYWTIVVTAAYVYNLVFVILRYVFVEFERHPWWLMWIILDALTDFIYLIDMFIRTRTGFLEQGLLVRDLEKIKKLYKKSLQYKFDLASMIPIDYVNMLTKQALLYYLPSYQFRGLPFRFNRLLRVNRVTDCRERTETRSSMPNAFRVFCVVLYIIVIIHWNACFYFFISECIGLGKDTWVYGSLNKQSLPDGIEDTLARRYIYSFYWSTLILTTIGEVPGPVKDIEFFFVTMDLMCGVLIFATIVGNVGSMISNMSAARTEFQNKMDGIKQYMELRRVSKQLEMRVIKWFDYLWANKQSLSDQLVLKVLPDKLQAEIAMQVHFETLRKVRIFQDCEAGLLAELVLKLQLQVFSPGDYICRKGDIGREMYIVKRGKLQVVAEDGVKVFATLQEGAVFGELSILNIAGSKNGNRRTANVRSVGYTDLFVLNKNDLWSALREYPDARKLLLAKGRELLRKDNLLNEGAPDEQASAEELAETLNTSVKGLQIRLARLIAEHTSHEMKLAARIEFLETQLKRYKAMAAERTNQPSKARRRKRRNERDEVTNE